MKSRRSQRPSGERGGETGAEPDASRFTFSAAAANVGAGALPGPPDSDSAPVLVIITNGSQ